MIWPTDVIAATIALAALHNEILKAGADLTLAAKQQDPRMMLGAAQGLAQVTDQSIPNAQILTKWPDTRSVGEAYVPMLAGIRDASNALATALQTGDAPGVGTASQRMGEALQVYHLIYPRLVDLVDIAVVMRRGLLVK